MILYVLVIIIFLLYLYLRYENTYWTRHNVKQLNPIVLFGDGAGLMFGRESVLEMGKRIYDAFPNERYVGFYQMMNRVLFIRDPDLIKQITIKDFENFMDHRPFVPDDFDPFWAKNLIALRGSKWKEMRSTLSPTFTATKMRAMFILMDEIARQFTAYFEKRNESEFVLEMKDVLRRYGNDAIASCAFGIKCNSLEERDNEFYLNGIEATDMTSPGKSFKMLIFFLLPKIAKLLNFRLFSKQTGEFFLNVTKNNIKTREEQGIIRPDVIHLLMEARKGNLQYEDDAHVEDAGFATAKETYFKQTHKVRKYELTDLDIAAQALIFFFAGFDNVSTIMLFAFYELALNTHVQEKLRDEIDDVYNECNGKVTYSDITKMKYLDMILSETLRKWPSFMATDRECMNSYTIEAKRPGEKTIHLNPGDVVGIPIIGLHRDPQYYPDPEKFDPERFSDANKHKINPYTYLPFGSGPRNCIGSRFALLKMKTLIFNVFSKFEVLPCAETAIPAPISKKHFNLLFDGDCKLLFRKRT